jgi:hypothetical protein
MKRRLGVAIGIRPPSRTNRSGLLKNDVFVPEGLTEGRRGARMYNKKRPVP